MPNTLPVKDRMKIERHDMPAQDPQARISNFNEVNQGFTPELAHEEALRCLNCKDAPCSQGCPVHVHIPDFIGQIVDGNGMKAAEVLLRDNLLPAVCGRVCPQEKFCESHCVLGKKGKPVAIGSLERFTADSTAAQRASQPITNMPAASGKKVALIGSGPSSLACAGDLIRMGHRSRSSKRCMLSAVCWFTVFPNSAYLKRSSRTK
jgi:glutamate synthase (NADPH/NADH) small chain